MAEIPENLSRFYPEDYGSFKKPRKLEDGFLRSFCRRRRARYDLYSNGIIGRLLAITHKAPRYEWFKRAKITFESEILDVGSGIGRHLIKMQKEGFSNLTGIDPFIDCDISYENGVNILKKNIFEIKGSFDFIMLHHSFEHMPRPSAVLNKLFDLLRHQRYVLIRIPVVSSFAWREYGINWVQIDAPRHLFLHSTKSMQTLVKQTGFKLADIVFDSTEMQFYGSEQYCRNVPLRDSRSYEVNPEQCMFSRKEIQAFRAKAVELNSNNDGDSACFYLYKE